MIRIDYQTSMPGRTTRQQLRAQQSFEDSCQSEVDFSDGSGEPDQHVETSPRSDHRDHQTTSGAGSDSEMDDTLVKPPTPNRLRGSHSERRPVQHTNHQGDKGYPHGDAANGEPHMMPASFIDMLKSTFQEMTATLVTTIRDVLGAPINRLRGNPNVPISSSASKRPHAQQHALTEKQGTRKISTRGHFHEESNSTPRSIPKRSSVGRYQLNRRLTDEDCSSSGDSNTESEDDTSLTRGIPVSRRSRKASGMAKLPIFTGREKWDVWFNRFEAVARLQGWTEADRLEEMLPRLQGVAGEFTFGQLRPEILQSYRHLVKELKNRFDVVETAKVYAAKFECRIQNSEETVEAYAAELKRLYDKGYKYRSARTRREDLLRRFLIGLLDDKARIHVELNKDPQNIDEAVAHIVHYIETVRYPQSRDNRRKPTRQVQSNTGADKSIRNAQKTSKQNSQKGNDEFITIRREELQKLIQEEMRKEASSVLEKQHEMTHNAAAPNRNFQCYACGDSGHFARNCPNNNKQQSTVQKGHRNTKELNPRAKPYEPSTRDNKDQMSVANTSYQNNQLN